MPDFTAHFQFRRNKNLKRTSSRQQSKIEFTNKEVEQMGFHNSPRFLPLLDLEHQNLETSIVRLQVRIESDLGKQNHTKDILLSFSHLEGKCCKAMVSQPLKCFEKYLSYRKQFHNNAEHAPLPKYLDDIDVMVFDHNFSL